MGNPRRSSSFCTAQRGRPRCSERARKACRWRIIHSPAASIIQFTTRVATPAPMAPIAGRPRPPKMNQTLNTSLKAMLPTLMAMTSRVWEMAVEVA